MISCDNIKEIIEPILRERSEVIVAYLYGSFLDSLNYNDIDIGLLLDDKFTVKLLYKEKIERIIEEKIRKITKTYIPIDIQIINNKSLSFVFSLLRKRRILYCKDDNRRADFEARNMKEYIDFRPHIEIYNEERKLRYAD